MDAVFVTGCDSESGHGVKLLLDHHSFLRAMSVSSTESVGPTAGKTNLNQSTLDGRPTAVQCCCAV